MKKFIVLILSIAPAVSWSQDADSTLLQEYLIYYEYVDSLEQQLNYDSGSIRLGESLAVLQLPEGYKYLNPEETNKVVVENWGNPPSETLGMIIPEDVNPFSFDGWGVIVTYEEDGHIDDEDASEIDFEELLTDMQDEVENENEVRLSEGYEPYALEGWATPPHYDPETHKLYWALDLSFGSDEEAGNTLNYNVRILGREGVLVLNAVSGMDQLADVETHMEEIQQFTTFNEGERYTDFNPSVDKIASYGIGTLIAGKMAMKAGFFKVLLAFLAKGWKLILIGIAAIGAFIRRAITGGGKEKKENPAA